MWQYERDRENEIRTVQQDGEPWFVLKDVCGLLGLTDIGRTAKRLDSDELTRTTLVSGGQNREILIVKSFIRFFNIRHGKVHASPGMIELLSVVATSNAQSVSVTISSSSMMSSSSKNSCAIINKNLHQEVPI